MKNIIAVNSNTYHGFSLDEALMGIADAGFKFVELTATRGWTEHVTSEMTDEEIDSIKNKMNNLDITPIGLSGHCNLMEKERLDDFIDNIYLADKLGCKYIVTSTGEAHFAENEGFKEDILIENIKIALEVCKKLDIVMVLENHGEYATGASLKTITDKIDSDFLGINYDTANVVFYGQKMPEDEIKSCARDVKYIHLKDKAGEMTEWNFPAVGKGDLDLESVFSILKASNYQGPFSIEIEFTEDFTMNDKKDGDLKHVNKAVKDSYDYLKKIKML